MLGFLKRDPSKNWEFVLSQLRFVPDAKLGVVYVQGLYVHVIKGDVVLGRRVATTAVVAATIDKSTLTLPIGDRLESIQACADGIRATTLFQRCLSMGDCSRIATDASHDEEEVADVYPVRFPDDDASPFESFVTPAKLQGRLAKDLESTLCQLATIDAHETTKGRLNVVFQSFHVTFEGAAKWILPLAKSDTVCVVPYIAALNRIGRQAVKRVGFFLLRPWLGIGSSKLALNKLLRYIHRLNEAKSALFRAQSAILSKKNGDHDADPELYRSFAHTFNSEDLDVDLALALQDTQPRSTFKTGGTDRLLTHFITVGDPTQLDRVARTDAEARRVALPQAMDDFAKRVPAVRLAIKCGHASVLAWLITQGALECVDPPQVPSDPRLKLSITDHEVSTLELASQVEDREQREFMTSLLSTVISIRRFAQTSISLIERDDDAAPVTSDMLIELAQDMTNVTQLRQIERLAETCLPDAEQATVMAAAFEIVLRKELVKTDPALRFFVALLRHSYRGRLPQATYWFLKHRAQAINVQSASWAVKLQQAVRELQVASFNHNVRLAGTESSLVFLQQCVGDMQRDAAEANDRRRFVSILSAVLSTVCTPLCNAIDAWLDKSDPSSLLHMMMSDSTDVQRFITTSAVEFVLQPGVEGALHALHLDASTVVSGLRSAARRQLMDEGVELEETEVIYVVPLDEGGEGEDDGDLPVLEDEESTQEPPRRQLYQIVFDVIAMMKQGSSV